MERHHGIFQVIAQPAVGLDHYFLNQVASIDPPLEFLVHSQIDEPTHRFAVLIQQLVDRCFVVGVGS